MQKRMERKFRSRCDVGWVTGAALFIRRDVYQRLGGFDDNLFMFFEDKDLCFRVRQSGLRVAYDPSISLIHLKGGSSGGDSSAFVRTKYRESQRRYYEKNLPAFDRKMLSLYHFLIGEAPRA